MLLVGPGRWGTTSPSLGVPVRFPEIDRVSAVCELVTMSEHVAPDVSLGTHFFNDLIEWEMLYFALFPGRHDDRVNMEMLEAAPDTLPDLIPDAGRAGEAVRVIDTTVRGNAEGGLALQGDVLRVENSLVVENGGVGLTLLRPSTASSGIEVVDVGGVSDVVTKAAPVLRVTNVRATTTLS